MMEAVGTSETTVNFYETITSQNGVTFNYDGSWCNDEMHRYVKFLLIFDCNLLHIQFCFGLGYLQPYFHYLMWPSSNYTRIQRLMH
jgi:hypothetical protein